MYHAPASAATGKRDPTGFCAASVWALARGADLEPRAWDLEGASWHRHRSADWSRRVGMSRIGNRLAIRPPAEYHSAKSRCIGASLRYEPASIRIGCSANMRGAKGRTTKFFAAAFMRQRAALSKESVVPLHQRSTVPLHLLIRPVRVKRYSSA